MCAHLAVLPRGPDALWKQVAISHAALEWDWVIAGAPLEEGATCTEHFYAKLKKKVRGI